METVKEFSVFLENKPGRLANVCLALARDKVNIAAMTVSEGRDRSVLRMITDNLPQTRSTLKALNTPFEEGEVVRVEMRNHPGALGQVCEMLGMEHINIEHCYGSSGARNGKAFGIFKVSNTSKALRVLAEGRGRLNGRRPIRGFGMRRRGRAKTV